MNVLILYASIEGQTHKIAKFVNKYVLKAGHTATLVDAGQKGAILPLENVDRVILAASIHLQRHPIKFERFVSAHNLALTSYRTLMISVSLCAAFPEGLDEAKSYMTEMRKRTSFTADTEALVAGALQFNKYRDYESQVVRLIGLHLERYESVDGNKEFTDWPALERTISDFLDA